MRSTRRSVSPTPVKRWFRADKGEVHRLVFDYVANVERAQFSLYNRFVQLEELYDPNAPNRSTAGDQAEAVGLVIENVIASNVDTVTAQIAATDVRARFMTDDGDWSVQRTAKRLEYYAEGLGKTLDINRKARLAFRSAAKKGTGIVKVYADQFEELKIDHVRVDDVVVDESECKSGGSPRQMHQRMVDVDREELKAQFPEHEEKIDAAQTGRGWGWRRTWAGYRPMTDDGLVVIESWKLPIGRKGKAGYIPGRHVIAIDGADLLDEEWHKTGFPFVCIMWSERDCGWYGISLAERIVGIQRALNKRNWQIDRNLDHYAVPVTYVDMADAKLAVQTINRIGTVVVTKGTRPTTQIPQANSPEVYQNRIDLKQAAQEDSGVNTMSAHGTKPAGLDSGRALMEYRDQTTQRFAIQEEAFEYFVLCVYLQTLDVCKDLGDAAPVITRKAKFGSKKIKWADVDMQDVKVQIAAASSLPRTPAGRYQIALEWAQAGVISTDEWRKISDHPDLDRILSLYTQGMESVERDIEAIEDGHAVTPEPYGNLLLMTRVGQMAILRDRDNGAPEEILESLRTYTVLAAWMYDQKNAANQNMAAGADAGTGMPAGTDTSAANMAPMPALPDQPAAQQPVAALSPQAMNLMAS